MLSNRPYLARAFYQWIVDSGLTPILVLDANHPRCIYPKEYEEEGEITFNISPSAIREMKMLNHSIEFTASFSGMIHHISAPIKAVMAIYAEENGEGIFFDAEEDDGLEALPADPGGKSHQPVVHLKSIDNGSNQAIASSLDEIQPSPQRSRPVLTVVE